MALLRARTMSNAELRREIVAVAERAAAAIDGNPESAAALRALLRRHGPEQLARILWQYVRQRTRYIAESGTQRVRYPAALLREGVGDCKSTGIFLASMLRAAGVPVLLRFVQTHGRPWYGHVYAVAPGVGPVDPLLPFGTEVDYLRREDHNL